MPLPRACSLIFLAMIVWSSIARGDLVRLSNGGEVRGQLRSRSPGSPIELETLLGGKIVLAPEQASSVSRRSIQVEEYVTRSREIPGSVDAHWELAEWCRENQLIPQRAEQLEAIVELDPGHQRARQGLGHIQYRGEWMSRDEAMRAQGYVKHKGKYITQQELDLANKTGAQRQAEVAWFPKVRQWVGWVENGNSRRREEGLQSLSSIDDPHAIRALDEFVGGSSDPKWRIFLIERLNAIAGEQATPVLVRLSLHDSEEKIRTAAFSAIEPAQHEIAVPHFVEALEDDANEIVQRAAEALGVVGDTRVVPQLIRALVTRHKIKIQVPVQDAVSLSGVRGSGRYNLGNTGSGLPPNIELLLRTGQLPYGVQVIQPNVRYQTVSVRVDLRNDKALASLKTLTDADFGYDQDAWQLYWASHQSGVGKL